MKFIEPIVIILSAFAKLRKTTINFMSVCLHRTTRLTLDRFSLNLIYIWMFKKYMSRKFTFYWYLTRIRGASREDKYTFLIISLSVLLRNISDQLCRENQNTNFIFQSLSFFLNCAVFEIMLKNILEPGRSQMTMRTACWISNATNTHS